MSEEESRFTVSEGDTGGCWTNYTLYDIIHLMDYGLQLAMLYITREEITDNEEALSRIRKAVLNDTFGEQGVEQAMIEGSKDI